MNRPHLPVFLAVLALIGATAFGMSQIKSHQKMGQPGVRTEAIPGDLRRKLYLPDKVLDYIAKPLPVNTNLVNGLPPDTSFLQTLYFPVDFSPTNHRAFDPIQASMVLMGTDRTSIHKPEFCLTGQGWPIDSSQSGMETIHILKPQPYDLQIMKFVSTRQLALDGKDTTLRGIYMFWFVADNDLTADHKTRMWHSAIRLMTTGELERWAYVSFFAVCLPGQEEATTERLKKFIAEITPEFMLTTNTSAAQAKN